MKKDPAIKVQYEEPKLPGSGVKNIDDVHGAATQFGLFKTEVYGGKVDAFTGGPGMLPPRWSGNRTGAGTYEITHDLNTLDYAVVVNATDLLVSLGPVIANITTKTETYFEVTWCTPGSIMVNTPFNFIVVKHS